MHAKQKVYYYYIIGPGLVLACLCLLFNWADHNFEFMMGAAVFSMFGLSTTATDSDDQESQTVALSESFVRVSQHYDEISKALNPIQLMPLLSKEGLLDFHDKSILLGASKSTLEKSYHVLEAVESKGPSAYSKFLSCVQAEKSHMGHEYIASLLQDKSFGSEFELKESLKLKEAINRCTPEMMDICLTSLVPLMFSKSLLTNELY